MLSIQKIVEGLHKPPRVIEHNKVPSTCKALDARGRRILADWLPLVRMDDHIDGPIHAHYPALDFSQAVGQVGLAQGSDAAQEGFEADA